MKKLKFLITAGPTREPIDPVRFISNRSSGKMGYALAAAARKAGHSVRLISGPVALPCPPGCCRTMILTAREMLHAVLKYSKSADVIIMAAAVADYTPQLPARGKIKKSTSPMLLRLTPTRDILRELGQTTHRSRFLLVGFAAETGRLIPHARKKLISKNLDLIIANKVGVLGSGFESDDNCIVTLDRWSPPLKWPKATKAILGKKLLPYLMDLYDKTYPSSK